MKLKNIFLVGQVLIVSAAILGAGCAGTETQEKYNDSLIARARAHTELGAVYYQQKQYEVALEEFNLAVKVDPKFALAYNGLGLVYADLGKTNEADAYFKKAIQLDPNNSESHNNYGAFLCARNRIDESITQFLEAVKNPLYSTPAIAYTNAGVCAARKNDIVKSEDYFKKALQADPLSHAATYQMANSQFKRKDFIKAKKTLQNVLLTQPGPEILWLAVQIERKLGSQDEEADYAQQLRKQYPDSEQAKLMLNGK
ncbi:MAG: type IV pilus biogenesis/stability protein PilW [Methylophilaceae bacterium]